MNTFTLPQEITSPSQEKDALLAGKYHSVEALEQGYRELSRLVREKTPEVPEAYEVDFSDDPALKDYDLREDPLWQHITPVMKEAALTQPQAQAVTKAFMAYQIHQAEEEKKAFAALGDQGHAMAREVENFIGKNFNAEEAEFASYIASNVAGLKFLQKMAALTGEKTVPIAANGAAQTGQSLKEKAFAMLKDPELAYNREKQDAYNKIWQDIARS